MGTKLKDILKESVLGELPSSKMFKYNKATGKYEAPGQHTNEEVVSESKALDIANEILNDMIDNDIIGPGDVKSATKIIKNVLNTFNIR